MFTIGRLSLLAYGALLFAIASAGAADTLKIGMIAEASDRSGPLPVVEEINGAKLALDEINKAGGVLGRQVELVIEDTQSTSDGAVSAFGKLASNPEIAVFLGPGRSAFIHAIAPDVMKVGKPMMIGGTDPKLTHMGNPWLFRFRPNDTYSAKVIAEFGVKNLNRKKWAIVHTDDAFGISGKNALTEELRTFSVEPVIVQGFAPETQDFTPFVQAVKQLGADVVATYLFYLDPASLAKQMHQNSIDAAWIGSPTITGTEVLRLAGPALNGAYGVTDFAAKARPAAQAFAQKYQAAYNLQADMLSAWNYDAMNMLAKVITSSGSTEPDKIRGAILDIQGYEGANGTYNFDQNGDGLHGYNIVRNDNGTWVFDRHIEFKD
jgi:branched-chain amino acid transport system substrate-binding protein